jgi:hypothetical protein
LKTYNIVAFLLIAAGILGLVYTQFSYTKDTHEAIVGPIELLVKEKQTVVIPLWASIASIIAGAGMIFFENKKELFAKIKK